MCDSGPHAHAFRMESHRLRVHEAPRLRVHEAPSLMHSAAWVPRPVPFPSRALLPGQWSGPLVARPPLRSWDAGGRTPPGLNKKTE